MMTCDSKQKQKTNGNWQNKIREMKQTEEKMFEIQVKYAKKCQGFSNAKDVFDILLN